MGRLALGCSLTPRLRTSFGSVTCMARAASVSGPWTLSFLLSFGVRVWVRGSSSLGLSWFRIGVWYVLGFGLLSALLRPWLGLAVCAGWFGLRLFRACLG